MEPIGGLSPGTCAGGRLGARGGRPAGRLGLTPTPTRPDPSRSTLELGPGRLGLAPSALAGLRRREVSLFRPSEAGRAQEGGDRVRECVRVDPRVT